MGATVIPFPRRPGHEPWCSKRQVADHLGVSERTVERWVGERGMPAHKTGPERMATVRFLLSEVDDWFGGDAA